MDNTQKKMSKSEAGRKGGNTTKARHGIEHYRRAGKLGFAALAKSRGFVGGGRLGALQWLGGKGKIAPTPEQTHARADALAWAEGILDALPDPREDPA